MRIAILFSATTVSGVLGSILVCTHRFYKKYNAYYYSRHTVLHKWMAFVV
jgi:hypothetical protein